MIMFRVVKLTRNQIVLVAKLRTPFENQIVLVAKLRTPFQNQIVLVAKLRNRNCEKIAKLRFLSKKRKYRPKLPK